MKNIRFRWYSLPLEKTEAVHIIKISGIEVPGFVQEHTIETTGAGDTFCANSLNYILEHGMEELTEENLKELLTFANAAASLITTRKGALRVMPTREEIKNFIQNV